jgi:hypothetical protein
LRPCSEFDATGWYRAILACPNPLRRHSFPNPALRSSHPTVTGGWFSFRPRTSPQVTPHFRVFAQTRLARANAPAPPLGFPSVRHMRQPRSGSPGRGQRPAPSVHRVWSPSRRLAPSTALPTLFQIGSVHRIHPSEP